MHATHHPPADGTTPTEPTPTRPGPAPADTTVAHTLRDAATYLDRHGWIQRHYYADGTHLTPAACAAGALAIVAYGHTHPEPHSPVPVDYDVPADLDGWHAFITAESFLELFLGVRLNDGDDPESLSEWNDTDDRTRTQVIATLHAAADAAEAALS